MTKNKKGKVLQMDDLEIKENTNKDDDYKMFEDIKHIDEDGNEYWWARELMPLLEYLRWENFQKVIKKAIKSYKNSEISVFEQFREVTKLIEMAKGAKREIEDYKLSRYVI